MQTAEFLKNSIISVKSKSNSKLFLPLFQGSRWIRILKNIEVENLVTHALSLGRPNNFVRVGYSLYFMPGVDKRTVFVPMAEIV